MRRKLAALIALSTTACTSWRVQPGPAPSAPASGQPGSRTLIQFKTGASIELYDVALTGDSLIGMTDRPGRPDARRVAIDTAEVRSVATRGVSPGRTLLAIAVIALATLAIVGAANAGSSDTQNSSCDTTSTA